MEKLLFEFEIYGIHDRHLFEERAWEFSTRSEARKALADIICDMENQLTFLEQKLQFMLCVRLFDSTKKLIDKKEDFSESHTVGRHLPMCCVSLSEKYLREKRVPNEVTQQ